MNHPVITVQEAVTAFAAWIEPTAAELDDIEREMPVIEAEMDLLDTDIACLDRVPTELDARRLRRSLHRVLDARRVLANHSQVGGAA